MATQVLCVRLGALSVHRIAEDDAMKGWREPVSLKNYEVETFFFQKI
jgi:hypothetical protein